MRKIAFSFRAPCAANRPSPRPRTRQDNDHFVVARMRGTNFVGPRYHKKLNSLDWFAHRGCGVHIIAIQPGDKVDADSLRTDRLALAVVGAASEAELVHGVDHPQ